MCCETSFTGVNISATKSTTTTKKLKKKNGLHLDVYEQQRTTALR